MIETPVGGPAGGSPFHDERWPPLAYWARVVGLIALALALGWAVVTVAQIIVLVLIALVFGIGLQRPTNWLEAHGVRRGVALALMVGSVIITVAGLMILVVPSVTRSIEALVNEGPSTLDRFRNQAWVRRLDQRFDLETKLEDLAADLPSQVAGAGWGILTLVGGGLTVLVLTLYFASALPQMIEGTSRLLRPAHRERFEIVAKQVTDRIGGYVVGNGIVSLIAGGVTFVGLLVIGVPFPAALAFWVAITDLIPSIGALVGAVVVLAVSASGGPGMFITTGVFVIVYQAIENYVIVPRVMRNAVDLSVGAVLISVLVGGALAGFAGVLLALPITASIRAVVEELYFKERRREVKREEVRARLQRARAERSLRRGAKLP